MTHRNRKENIKPALVVASLAALVGAAHAQSSASSQSSIDFSFSVDSSSADPAADLSITDNGEETYNLISTPTPPPSPYFAPYAQANGADASASTFQSPFITYDPSSMSGYNGVGSYASESGTTGSAAASVGSQEYLSLSDTGSNSITLDINAEAFVEGGASAMTGSASETSYAGIYAFNQNGGAAIDQELAKLVSTQAGQTYSTIGSFASGFLPGQYFDTFTLTINSGETVGLDFYASGIAQSNAEAVPAPTGAITLGVGLMGLLLRRRRR